MLPGYSTEIVLAISAPPAGLAAGTVMRCSQFETRALAAAGQCRPDRKDFRLLYNGVEIDRVMLTTGHFAFRLQASLGSNEATSAYAVDYGNPSEATSPKENPRNVWPKYFDGDDLASLTRTGTTSAINVARPGFLKLGAGKVIKREPGTTTEIALRQVEMYWDGTYYWASADPVQSVTTPVAPQIAMWRSTDLINWERRPNILGLGDLIIHSLPGISGLVGTFITGSGNYQGSIGMPPYTMTFATATNPEGPWTTTGNLPLGGGGSIDSVYNVDGHFFTPDNGTNWYLFYGAAGNETGVTSALATKTGNPATSGWTKLGAITPWGQGENPRFLNDAANNHSYLLSNLVGGARGEGYTRSNTLRETTAWSGGVSFGGSPYVLTALSPGDPGEWDDFAIGVLGMPVIKDGMIYMGYDGSNQAEVFASPFTSVRANVYRDGSFVEAAWPFKRANAISLNFGATVTTPTLINAGADGEVRVRCSGSLVELRGATTNFSIDAGSPDEFGGANFGLNVNGTPTAPVYNVDNNVDGNGVARTQTFLFRRSGGVLSVYIESMLFYQGPSTEALALKVTGAGVIEEIQSVGTVVTIYPPIEISVPTAQTVLIPWASETSIVDVGRFKTAFGEPLSFRVFDGNTFTTSLIKAFNGSIFE